MIIQEPVDPTRIREQPALTTSSGTVWIVGGGAFAMIALIVLIRLTALQPAGVALGGAIAVALLYVGMVVVRFTVADQHRRLAMLAAAMLAMASVALVVTAVMAAAATVPAA